ncbi:hypothetical protein ACVI1L_001868 [Bradyrhizobium sp. USDA 4516]
MTELPLGLRVEPYNLQLAASVAGVASSINPAIEFRMAAASFRDAATQTISLRLNPNARQELGRL